MGKLDGFLKVRGIKELKRYNLPFSKTIFIFDFKQQEKEIDNFIKNRRYISVRSDSRNGPDFCPHNLKCPKEKAKKLIKNLNSRGYAVIIQEYVPWIGDIASGNILILKKSILVELMGEGPLIWLNRDGKVEERIKFKRDDLRESEHSGKRLIGKKRLLNILKMIRSIPPYKVVEFTLRPEGLYFWQIRGDRTARKVETWK